MDGQDNNQYNPYQNNQQQPQQPNPYQPQQGQYNPYQQPQQPNPYQQGYYQQPVSAPKNANAIAGMVLGIVSIALCWWWYIGLAAGVVGLVLSIMAKKQGPNKMATAGLICSIIGLGIAGIVTIAALACASSFYYWY